MEKAPSISRFDANQITNLLNSYDPEERDESKNQKYFQDLSSALLAILEDQNFSLQNFKQNQDLFSVDQKIIVAFTLHVKQLYLQINDLKLQIALAEEEKKQAQDELQDMQKNFENVIKQAKTIASNSPNPDDFTKNKQDLNDTNRRLQLLKESYDKETKEKQKLKEKLAQSERDHQSDISRISSALQKNNPNKNVDDIVSEIITLNSQLMKMQTQTKQLELKQQTIKDTMKEESTNIADENIQLSDELKRLSKMLESVTNEKATLLKDNEQLTQTVNNLQITNDQLKNQIDKMDDKIIEIQKEKDNLVDLLALETEKELGLSENNDKLEEEAKKLRDTLKKHEKTLGQFTTTERMSATVDLILDELQKTKAEVMNLNNYKIRSIKLINKQHQMILYYERYVNEKPKPQEISSTNEISESQIQEKENVDLISLFSSYIENPEVKKVLENKSISANEKSNEIYDILFREKDTKINFLSQLLNDQLLFIDAIVNQQEETNSNIYQNLQETVQEANNFLNENAPGLLEDSSIFNLLDIDEDPQKLSDSLATLFAHFPQIFDETNNEIMIALRQSIIVISVLRRFAQTARMQFAKKTSEITKLKQELEQTKASFNNFAQETPKIKERSLDNPQITENQHEKEKVTKQQQQIEKLTNENTVIKHKMKLMQESLNQQIDQTISLADVKIAASEAKLRQEKANIIAEHEKKMYDFISQIAEVFNTTSDIYQISDERSCLTQIKLLVEKEKEISTMNNQLIQYKREIEEIRSLLKIPQNKRTVAIVKSLLRE